MRNIIISAFQVAYAVDYPGMGQLMEILDVRQGFSFAFAYPAALLGSKDLADYPSCIPALRSYTDNYTEKSLLYGESLGNVAIEGRGTIDGQGAAFKGPYKVRPYLLRLISCRDVSVRGITLKNSPMWVQHYLGCDGILLDGITVASRCNQNNDGIDVDGCQRVRISNCDILSGDDARRQRTYFYPPGKPGAAVPGRQTFARVWPPAQRQYFRPDSHRSG